jgi:hypothetical protein
VTRIDRLARPLGDLQDIVRTIRAKGAQLKATEQPIDTSTAAGKAFLDMLSVFAEFETALRRERHLEGIAKAGARRGARGSPRSRSGRRNCGRRNCGRRNCGRRNCGRRNCGRGNCGRRGCGRPRLPKRSASAGRPSTTSSAIPSPAPPMKSLDTRAHAIYLHLLRSDAERERLRKRLAAARESALR